MANVIRIKRRASGNAGAPASLKNAELAFNEIDQKLYYGKGDDGNGNATTVVAIGGVGWDASTDLSGYATFAGTNEWSGSNTFNGTVNLESTFQIDAVAVTTSAAELNLLDGSVADTVVNGKAVIYGAAGEVAVTTLTLGGTDVTSTAAELNILDGVTADKDEINLLDTAAANTVVNSKAVIYGSAGQVAAASISTTGNVGVGGDLTVTGNLTVQGTTITLNTETVTVEDKNIILGNVAEPTDTTADGGGITLKGTSDKTFNWVDATDAWTSSEHVRLAAGKNLVLGGSSSGTVTVSVPAAAGTTTITFPATTGTVALVGDKLSAFAATTSAELAGVISDETGTGALVFANTPTLVTPVLGTPTSGTLTNCSGLPISTGVSGLGTGVATFLATPSSANLASAVTDETGSGSLVFATSPTLVTPTLGAASATSVNKVTITEPATAATLTIANNKTLTVSNTLTFTGTDSSSVAFGAGGTVVYESTVCNAISNCTLDGGTF
jgi:hypothetical protein